MTEAERVERIPITDRASWLALRQRDVTASARRRFESFVSPEPNSGCWLWTGHVNAGGYGTFQMASKSVHAHRVSYSFHRGDIPDGLHVLHRCDVRCCVNPDHLFLGSNADNVADKVSKGRQARTSGERHPAAILTSEQALEIYRDERPLSAIAAAYGVTKASVTAIRTGRTWAEVTGGVPIRRPKPVGEAQGTAKLTTEVVLAIRSDNRSQSEVAKYFGLAQSTVSRVRSRKTWSHVD